ncbi:hypothetical protein OH77DRAFT_505748 [Trametes cingulata]|nr:hypothetical protein OH77DRAFT_505748 [Trametes cingulata]
MADATALGVSHTVASPFDRLPNEIVIHVLGYIHSWLFDRLHDHTARWIRFLAVCSRWRDIILSTPRFWSIVFVKESLARLEYLLMHSKGTLKDVRFEGSTSLGPQQTSILATHSASIRQLTIHLDHGLRSAGWLPQLTALLWNDMPALESFSCVPPANIPIPFPELGVSVSRFPRLSSLDLMFCNPPDGIANLKFLKLRCCFWDISFHDFLQVLANCPHLQELHFENTNYCQSDTVPDPTEPPVRPPVCLQHLRRLTIAWAPSLTISATLVHIETPTINVTYIRASDEYENDIAVIGHVLSPKHGVLSIVPKFTSPPSACLNIRTGEYYVAALTRTQRIGLEICDIYGERHNRLPGAIQGMVDLFHEIPITTLRIYGDFGKVHAHVWAGFFRCFPALEKLEVVGWNYAASLWAGFMQASSTDPVIATETMTMCSPHLRSIRAVYLALVWESEHEQILSLVAGALRIRGESGAKNLEELVWDSTADLGHEPEAFQDRATMELGQWVERVSCKHVCLRARKVL